MRYLFIAIVFASVNHKELDASSTLTSLELGITRKWYHRKTQPEPEFDWAYSSLYMRFVLYERLSFMLEGSIWVNSHDKRYPNRDYKAYSLGGGIAARIISCRHFALSTSCSYDSRLWFDRSEERYHKEALGLILLVQMEYMWNIKQSTILLWSGPTYFYNEIRQYPPDMALTPINKSINNIGISGGVDINVHKHFSFFFKVFLVDYLQYRMGFGYRI